MRSLFIVSTFAALLCFSSFADARKHVKPVAALDAALPFGLGLIRQPFFDGLVNDGIAVISGLVSDIEIPEVNQHISDVAVLGAIDLTLNEIQIVRLDADPVASSLRIQDGFVQGDVRGLQIEIRAHWHYRKSHWPHISGSGHAKITSKDGRIGLSLAADFEDAGLVHIDVSGVDVDLNKFDISVTDGNASWLYNIIFDLFNGSLKKSITNAVKDALNNELSPNLNKLFQKQPLDVTLFNDKVHLNTGFFGSGPIFQANPALVVASNRLELSNVDLQACPYAPNLDPAAPPAEFEPTATLLAFADVNFLKCFGWAIRTSNAFKFRVTPDMLPDAVAILNVEAWEEIFVSVAKLYNGDDYILEITLAADPEINVDPVAGVSAKITINANWYVAATAKHPEVYVFSTDISIQGSALLDIKQDFYSGLISLGVKLDADSVHASGKVVDVEASIPRAGIDDELFDETLEELAPLIGAIAAGQLSGFDLVEVPVVRLRNPKVLYDNTRGALGIATQLTLVPLEY